MFRQNLTRIWNELYVACVSRGANSRPVQNTREVLLCNAEIGISVYVRSLQLKVKRCDRVIFKMAH